MFFKINFVQYLFIVSLICGTILRKSTLTPGSTVKRGDPIYRKMAHHYKVSRYIKQVIREIGLNHYHISKRYPRSKAKMGIRKLLPDLMDKLDYLYFFRSKNLLVYFFKVKGDPTNSHKIYFEGVDEIGDLKYLRLPLPHRWFNEYTLKSIHKNLSESGFLFQVTKEEVIRTKDQIHSIFRAFSYLNHLIYQKDRSTRSIPLEMEGYSMGGVLSQVFVYLLIRNEYIQRHHLHIDLYVIESWWGGNQEFYEYLTSYIKVHNVMCIGSILYYYNLFFQNYFSIQKYVQFPVKPLFFKYAQLPFPFAITEYFGDHHFISRFLKHLS